MYEHEEEMMRDFVSDNYLNAFVTLAMDRLRIHSPANTPATIHPSRDITHPVVGNNQPLVQHRRQPTFQPIPPTIRRMPTRPAVRTGRCSHPTHNIHPIQIRIPPSVRTNRATVNAYPSVCRPRNLPNPATSHRNHQPPFHVSNTRPKSTRTRCRAAVRAPSTSDASISPPATSPHATHSRATTTTTVSTTSSAPIRPSVGCASSSATSTWAHSTPGWAAASRPAATWTSTGGACAAATPDCATYRSGVWVPK